MSNSNDISITSLGAAYVLNHITLFQHCTMRFADGSNLRRHIQTHTNEKPHVCRACGKAFARGSILKEHLRTHARHDKRTGEKGKVVTSMIMHKVSAEK